MRIVGWGTNSVGSREENAVLWLALLMRGYFAERSAAMRALERWPDPQVAEAARSLAPMPDRPAPGRSPVEAELLVGFVGAVPPEVARGSRYCDALVVDVDVRLRCATLRTADAARCEALTKRDPRVRYLSLNRALPELEP
jgi:hypothetical protein